jgi:hypothetical protein
MVVSGMWSRFYGDVSPTEAARKSGVRIFGSTRLQGAGALAIGD